MYKLLITDVDGTLTDGKIYLTEIGETTKVFNVKDGAAIKRISNEFGIIPIIITGRKSPIVDIRAREIGVNEVYKEVENKLELIKLIASRHQVDLNEIIYCGDDYSDILALENVGLPVSPNDAVTSVKNVASLVARRNGGQGIMVDLYEYLITL